MDYPEVIPQDESDCYAAMEEFVCDIRNIRYVENHENWREITNFLNDHNLDVTPETLRFAFLALSKEQKLDLMPLGIYVEPQPQPAPAPSPQQPTPQSVMHVKARTTMYRNGQPLEGAVKSL